MTATAGSNPTQQMAQVLCRIVERDRSRWRRLVLLEALGLVVAAPLGYLWLIFFLDNVFHLPTVGRLAAMAIFLAGAGYLGLRLLRTWRAVNRQLTPDQVALAIERRTDPQHGVHNRLINALQLSRDGRAGDAHLAVIRENVTSLQSVQLQQAVETGPAMVRLAMAAVVVVLGVVFFSVAREQFTNAASRLFLPLADIAPIYRTTLSVAPGDVRIERGRDVTIHVRIDGQVPDTITMLRQVSKAGLGVSAGKSSVRIPVQPDQRRISYRIDNINQSTTYAVRGGDFVSRTYRIEVLAPAQLTGLEATLTYPSYVGKPDATISSKTGELEALAGTRAALTFTLDQPADEVTLLLERPGEAEAARVSEVALKPTSPRVFTGSMVFDDVVGYRLRTRAGDGPTYDSRRYSLRVLVDQPPRLSLTGLDVQTDAALDTALPVTLEASDDYGLAGVGLFHRIMPSRTPTDRSGEAGPTWQDIRTWDVADRALSWRQAHTLMPATLEVAEGDLVQVTLRGRDIDPARDGQWTTGPIFNLRIGGEGAALQVLYERILATEAALKALTSAQRQAIGDGQVWIVKLSPGAGLRWDDAANLEQLADGMKQLSAGQRALREQAAQIARDMIEQAGHLRLSLGVLADTEMVRTVNILNTVATREHPQAMRAALGDAKTTQERTVASLEQIAQSYVQFRQDWELANMMPFTQMLAQRQASMGRQSLEHAQETDTDLAASLLRSMTRRQEKMSELVGLVAAAMTGIASRQELIGPVMAGAFTEAAEMLGGSTMTVPMQEALAALAASNWSDAATKQEQAARVLADVYARLKEAQATAARQVLEALEKQASTVGEQGDAEELRQGGDSNVDLDESGMTLTDLIHMRKTAGDGKKHESAEKPDPNMYLFEDSKRGMLDRGREGEGQQFDILKLAERPGATPSFPNQSDREGNRVLPLIQEEFEDLVGELLEEADEMMENYETLNLNLRAQINEPGEIGKQGGDMNSVAAGAATGNMKPPTTDVGGASRVGRQGARSHGMAVGNESVNRRGRDEAQQAQENIGFQAGTMKEIKTDDMQADSSTGTGGKRVESDDPTSFNVKDAGRWSDEIAQHMDKAKSRQLLVDHLGDPLDPKVAELLRDMESQQEQVIERVKAIRKELRNLYLPTEHLDQLLADLVANLDRLKEKPDAQTFRMQMETLERLRGAAVVLHQASSGFEPSLRRQQAVRGRIIDEPPGLPPPGYEEAVKRYYQKLADQ